MEISSVVVFGVLHSNNPTQQQNHTSEIEIMDTESAIELSMVLNKYNVPCYVAINTNGESEATTIIYRNAEMRDYEEKYADRIVQRLAEEVIS